MLQNNTKSNIRMRMNAIMHIRKRVLAVTQGELANIASVKQATVSRWESGELSPSLEQMDAIRTEIIRRGLDWRDAWFFELPKEAAG